MKQGNKNKVLVIGLDGATFDLLLPLIDEGKLPILKSFIREGINGELESVVPPITAPAWSSFMTGKNPGKHGVYFFLNEDSPGQEISVVDASSRSEKTLWEILGEEGRRVLVMNVPTTYPPQPVNGVMVSCFLTPPGSRDYIYPQSLVKEIEEKFGKYPLCPRTPIFSANLSSSNTRRILKEVNEILEYKFKAASYLMEKYPGDFTMFHLYETDRIQHELWNLIDETHPFYNKKLAKKYRDKIIDYFCQVDRKIGQLIEEVDEDTTVFIMSDHGFGPIHRCIDLNAWLLKEGYIQIKKNFFSQLRYRVWKWGFTYETLFKFLLKTVVKHGAGIIQKFHSEKTLQFLRRGKVNIFFSTKDVDWSQTRAYGRVGWGGININLAGRDSMGSVMKEDYESLREEIVKKLKNLVDPDTGKRVEGKVHIREETFHGKHQNLAPDLIFLPMDNGYIAGNVMGFTSNQPFTENRVWPGGHLMNGILMAKGKQIIKGKKIKGAGIMDLAPSILHLMGLKVPKNMDGKVLTDLFTRDFLEKHEIQYQKEASPDEKIKKKNIKADSDEVIHRLKGLGYLR